MANIITHGIDAQVREERRRRSEFRRTEDIQRGLTHANVPQRGDYGLCRDLDKNLKDYCKYKDPKDRAKINAEYYNKQKDYRKHKVLGGKV